jgi:hypothetical protein
LSRRSRSLSRRSRPLSRHHHAACVEVFTGAPQIGVGDARDRLADQGANGPSHSQPVTSSRVWGVNSSGAALARLRRGPRCGGPVPRRPASGYAVPQRRYPAARAGCRRGLGPQARECAPQAESRGVTARRRRRAGPGAGRPARTGPR